MEEEDREERKRGREGGNDEEGEMRRGSDVERKENEEKRVKREENECRRVNIQ